MRNLLLVLVWSCALLTACAGPVPVPLVVHKPPEFIRTTLPPAQTLWADVLRQSRTASNAAIEQDMKDALNEPGAEGQLYRAMLLSAPEHSQRDETLAASLADQVAVRRDASTAQRDAAVWYVWWLDAQHQIEQGGVRARTRAHEDQARIDALEVRVLELQRRAQDGEKRAADAERKLEALKQIERTLNERADRPVAPLPQPGSN
jgi:hypothetical protein